MTNKKTIIKLVTSTHKPLDTRIFHKEAKTLYDNNYLVKIIIPHSKNETVDGIELIAISPPKNGKEQLFITPLKIFKRALKESKKAFLHIHDSQLLFIGILLKCLGRKVIYDAHEDTPLQISYQHWIPSFLKGLYILLYKILEKIAGIIFDAIIVAEPVIEKYYPSRKTSLIRNFPLITSFKNKPYPPYAKREKSIVYVGLISEARGIHEMSEASSLANRISPFKFLLGGKFSPQTLKEKILKKAGNIDYLSWLSLDEVVETMLKSKIGIIIPQPNERYKTNYPVKLFEYMAAGLPVIASKEGVSSNFVIESKSGVLVNPTKPKEVAEAISYLLNHPVEAEQMGERGKNMVFSKYNWEKESEVLVNLYDELFKKVM